MEPNAGAGVAKETVALEGVVWSTDGAISR